LLLGFTLLLGLDGNHGRTIQRIGVIFWARAHGGQTPSKSARSQFEAGQTLARGLLTHRNKVNPALLREARGYFCPARNSIKMTLPH